MIHYRLSILMLALPISYSFNLLISLGNLLLFLQSLHSTLSPQSKCGTSPWNVLEQSYHPQQPAFLFVHNQTLQNNICIFLLLFILYLTRPHTFQNPLIHKSIDAQYHNYGELHASPVTIKEAEDSETCSSLSLSSFQLFGYFPPAAHSKEQAVQS